MWIMKSHMPKFMDKQVAQLYRELGTARAVKKALPEYNAVAIRESLNRSGTHTETGFSHVDSSEAVASIGFPARSYSLCKRVGQPYNARGVIYLMIEINPTRFKFPPYKHQLQGTKDLIQKPAFNLFWEMRTGKTKAVIDAACLMFEAGVIDAVVRPELLRKAAIYLEKNS
jgi:hypothetical protein